MRQELQHPLMTDVVEEALDVGIEYPVHTLLLQPRVERIERLMRVSYRPEPIRKALEVHLIDFIEDGHYGLLNNLVLQRRYAQRSLPSVGLRYVDSPRGLCPVRATMDTVVQIGEPTFQPRLILAPRYAVHSWSRVLLQRVETLPQQIDSNGMQQSREPLLSPFPRRSAHAAQSLGHPCSALCRWSVGLRVVLLGLLPSLRRLRRGLPLFVRLLHRYYAAVRPLHCVHVRIVARRLRGPVYRFDRRSGGLPVLVHAVSRRARVFDHAASRRGSRFCRLGRMLPSR